MLGKILVIEDNPDNSKLVTWILEDENYEVVCAETAEIGLSKLEESAFDAVLMDISLPGMNGKEATQCIRKNPRLEGLPVLALTAHAIKGERESILESGVNDLLTKPLDEEDLIAKLKHWIES
ncbi:MAG: response regulator [Cellvibrionaceae bacterium]